MSREKLNRSFDIPLEYIEDIAQVKVNGELTGYDRVIPPKGIKSIEGLSIMEDKILYELLRHVPLRGTNSHPYADSEFRIDSRGPYLCDVGQKFALEEKVLSILRAFGPNFFRGYSVNSLSEIGALKIYGRDDEGKKALAFYLPPIIEIHDDRAVLIDGIHRNFIAKLVGPIKAIHISYVNSPLPFDPITWNECPLVREKPPKDERYNNLDIRLFRDLTALGIDG